jgi:hypothetical protein
LLAEYSETNRNLPRCTRKRPPVHADGFLLAGPAVRRSNI